MEEKEIRAALELHWSASAAGDQDAEHDKWVQQVGVRSQ